MVEQLTSPKKSKKKCIILSLLIIVVIFAVIIYTQITIFVIQPIGAVPEGRTVVMLKFKDSRFETKFIDSADAICKRVQGNVNLICRGSVLGVIGENATIILRLPYQKNLYEISTGGKIYDR